MLDDLSPAVERALAAARQRSGDGKVNAVHLFLALIEDDEGRAAQVLVEAGGDLTEVRKHLEGHPHVALDIPAVLGGAREVAGERAESTVTGEFLLLGLVRSLESLLHPLKQGGVVTDRLVETKELEVIPLSEPIEFRDAPDFTSAARAVDANSNRSREALRVIDDYCRFVLNDQVLTNEVKSLRHRLAELLDRIPSRLLNESRDTAGDVGTELTAAGEMHRESTADVARINFKRLQESLRSLEEFGKVVLPEIAPGLEAIRYNAYTLERSVSISSDSRERLHNTRLYVLLTGSQCLASLDWTIREAAEGGATMFQLREKSLCDRELLERARNVRRWTHEVGALFIVNDRPDIARLAEADGVHLGQDDMSVADARKILGPGALIGVSTHTAEQLRRAVVDGASYIGVGPTFASSTKEFEELAGLEFVRQAMTMTTLPAFVIGGVNAENIGQVVAAGGRRVAVSAAICGAEEPQTAAAILLNALMSNESGSPKR